MRPRPGIARVHDDPLALAEVVGIDGRQVVVPLEQLAEDVAMAAARYAAPMDDQRVYRTASGEIIVDIEPVLNKLGREPSDQEIEDAVAPLPEPHRSQARADAQALRALNLAGK